MQKQVKDIDRLLDIEEFSSLIIEKLQEINEVIFNNDEVLKWALFKWLENIGEATYQLSQETIAEFNKVDWRSFINARHFYVHHYFDVEWPRVWKTLTTVDFKEINQYVKQTIIILRERYSK